MRHIGGYSWRVVLFNSIHCVILGRAFVRQWMASSWWWWFRNIYHNLLLHRVPVQLAAFSRCTGMEIIEEIYVPLPVEWTMLSLSITRPILYSVKVLIFCKENTESKNRNPKNILRLIQHYKHTIGLERKNNPRTEFSA